MIARRIQGATHFLGAPDGMDNCASLAVRQERNERGQLLCASAWEPTPEELALLNAGGSVVLWVVGGQPPVALTVTPFED